MPEGIWNTDDAPTKDVIRMLAFCAGTWVPDARLLGNVRAADIVRACNEVLEKWTDEQ